MSLSPVLVSSITVIWRVQHTIRAMTEDYTGLVTRDQSLPTILISGPGPAPTTPSPPSPGAWLVLLAARLTRDLMVRGSVRLRLEMT